MPNTHGKAVLTVMRNNPKLSVVAGVLGALSLLTSPVAVAKLLAALAKTPFLVLRSVSSFLFPSLFWKKVKGEVCFITGGAGGIGKLMAMIMVEAGAHGE